MRLRTQGFCIAVLLMGAAFGAPVAERDLERGTRILWDSGAFGRTPQTWPVEDPAISNDYGRVEGVQPIWIEGERYRGKPTRVFAWWGLPKGASVEAKVPAMVLVHGGGGTAFARWVKTWTDRGYAAIAMDTCGKAPRGERDGKPHPAHAWSGPSGWGASVAQVGEPKGDQWTFHAVSAIARCHSFLRSLSEVDEHRTGITGISWGGYLTSIAMCVDRRFQFAAPVYGCGYYDLNPEWHKMNADPEKFRTWIALWDPKNYLQDVHTSGGVRCPVLWCDGTNDRWYTLEMIRRSCNLVDPAVPLSLSLKLRMAHAHPPAGDPPEIAAYADHYLKGATRPPAIDSAFVRDGRLQASFSSFGDRVVRAELLSTCSTNIVLKDRVWTAVPVAGFDGTRGRCAAPVPEQAKMFFLNLVTEKGLVVSTRVFEHGGFGLLDNPRNSAAVLAGCALEKCEEREPVRVGTYNIRTTGKAQWRADAGTPNDWTDRRESVVALIRKMDLDVFGLQEVMPDQAAFFATALPEYAFVGEHRGEDRRSDEASPVAYRKSRFMAESSGTFWLSETPEKAGSKGWHAACPRVCSYLILRDRRSGRRLCFANTHTDHVSGEAREKGMLLVIDRMKSFGAGAPIVFVGDHNCRETEPPSRAVAGILRNALYASETPPSGSWRTWNGWRWRDDEVSAVEALKLDRQARNAKPDTPFYGRCGGPRIDYIYVSPDLRVLRYETVNDARPDANLYPSDHFPVSATVLL